MPVDPQKVRDLSSGVVRDQPAFVLTLTEDSGDIGGTNDGDLPDISTVSSTPSQAEVEAIRDAVREVAAKVNELHAVFVALYGLETSSPV